MRELAEKQGVKLSTITGRRQNGWSEEEILNGYRQRGQIICNGLTLTELSEKLGVCYSTVRSRHKRGKWTEEEMAEGKRKRGYKIKHKDRVATLKEWSEETGIPIHVLRTRLKDYYDTEDIFK